MVGALSTASAARPNISVDHKSLLLLFGILDGSGEFQMFVVMVSLQMFLDEQDTLFSQCSP